MKTINYYQPIIRAIAKNGSERLGVNVVTKIWDEEAKIKMELSVYGKNSTEALEKFNTHLVSEEPIQKTVEFKCEYYLCGKDIVKHFKPFEVSKSFKSGFKDDNDEYYVAWLNFAEVEKYYKDVIEPIPIYEKLDFWCRECIAGTMDSSKINMRNAKKNGLLLEISEKLDLTAEQNQAMTIYNLAQRFGCTPVELINKYL